MNIYNIFAPIYHQQRSSFNSSVCNRPFINWLNIKDSQSITYMKIYHKIFFLPTFVLLHVLRFVACSRIFVLAQSLIDRLNDQNSGRLDRNLIIVNSTSGKNTKRRHPPNKPHPLMFDIHFYYQFFSFPKITIINSKLS